MTTRQVAAFRVAGLSARTNNQDEMAGRGRIAGIWAEFMRNNPAALLRDKLGDEVYAVYCDYDSDHTGSYTFVLGFRVRSLDNLPPGISGVEVPSGDYVVVGTAKGPPERVVPAAWMDIWNDQHLAGTRSYKADFELYGHGQQAEIYLSVRLLNGL